MHKKKLFFWSLTSALAGFLFGFDTVVISGAEQTIQDLWGLNSTVHDLAISMALWGTVIGSLVGGWPTERWGRRKTLLMIGWLYFVSAVGSAFAPSVVFGFFCFMMILQLVWIKLMVPETKGVPLEEIQKKLGIK